MRLLFFIKLIQIYTLIKCYLKYDGCFGSLDTVDQRILTNTLFNFYCS